MKTRVRDLMTQDVAVIRRDQNLHDLEQLLLRRGVHGVPVVDEVARIVGVISQTDLLAWHHRASLDGVPFYHYPDDRTLTNDEGRPFTLDNLRAAPVSEAMSPLVHCIGPDKSIAEAASRMVREQIHRLVVVDEHYAVVGIVSSTDLLKAIPGVEGALANTA